MITTEQFGFIQDLYEMYNQELFNGSLKPCILNLSRKNGSAGFFIASRWKNALKEAEIKHEISINPDTFDIEDLYWHCTLVHEMAHLWQQDYGKPGRGGYHNKEWGDKMEEIGLMPSATGQPGGKKTGDRMGDYPIEGGKFLQVFGELNTKNLPFILNLDSRVSLNEDGSLGPHLLASGEIKKPRTKNGVKFKFQCYCGNNAWGKQDLKLICYHCKEEFVCIT